MSKIVIPEEFEGIISKRKLKSRMRRTETYHLRKQRIKRAQSYHYRYPCGYWVRETGWDPVYYIKVVPEHIERKPHYKYVYQYDPSGYMQRKLILTYKETKIPEKRIKLLDLEKSKETELPKFPRRANPGSIKKYLRQLSNRKLRRNNKLKLDNYNRSSYKKTFDLWWEVC